MFGSKLVARNANLGGLDLVLKAGMTHNRAVPIVSGCHLVLRRALQLLVYWVSMNREPRYDQSSFDSWLFAMITSPNSPGHFLHQIHHQLMPPPGVPRPHLYTDLP